MVTFIATLVLASLATGPIHSSPAIEQASQPASNYAGTFGLGIGRLRGDYSAEIFIRSSNTPNQSTVTGRATRPGSPQIEFRGTYFNATKRIKAFGEVRGAESAYSITLDGSWYPSNDVLRFTMQASEVATGSSSDKVEFYLYAGQAGSSTNLEVRVAPNRTQWGQNVTGEAVIEVSGLSGPAKLSVRGYVSYQFRGSNTMNSTSGTRISVECPGNGQYRIDLARLGINQPGGVEDPRCVVEATVGETTIAGTARLDADASREPLTIAYLTTFGGGSGKVGTKGRFGLHYVVTNSSNQASAAKITERIRFGPEGGAMANLPDHEWTANVVASGQSPRQEDARRYVELDFPREGRYRVEYEVSGPGVSPVRGFVTIDVTGGPTGAAPIRKGDIRGTIEIQGTSPEEGEPVIVGFKQTLSGIAQAVVTEEISAIGPSGSVVASTRIQATMTEGQTYSPRWVFNGREAGAYRIVAKITGDAIQPFETEGSVRVVPRTSSNGKTTTTGGATGQAVPGTYGLVKREPGQAAPLIVEPYGTWNTSLSPSSISSTWTATRDYEGTFSFSGTWDTPPSILKEGEIIELRCSAKASRSSTNQPYHGGNAEWFVEGAEMIQRGNSFAGSPSNGPFIASSESTLRFRVGSVRQITLIANGAIPGGGRACTYTYEWNAPPIQDSGDADEDPFAGRPTGLFPLQSDLPGADEENAQIEARVEPASITLRAGGMSEIVNVSVGGFRKRTEDQVTITFPQKTDGWASLSGGIVVTGGDGSYSPPNMGRPEHSDGFFFRARDNAPTGSQTIDIVVSQEGAGTVVLKLVINVVGRQAVVPPTNPTGAAWQGEWESNLDTLTLTQNGNQVSGQFGVDKNRVSGTAEGNVLTLKVYIGNEEFGTAKLTMSADGNSFTGEIAVKGGGDKIEWSGTRN